MNTTVTLRPAAASPAPGLRRLWQEIAARERRLARYGALLLLLLLPMALPLGLDERTLRGANVWVKPMKFTLSIALLAWTTAWFVGHLAPAWRRSRAVDRIVWLLVGTGTFELAYIVLQAALGEGSHYNVGDAWHGVMYTLMGLGALALTVTQPMLAWQLHHHADPARPAPYRLAVKLGLVLTFVLGAGVGIALGSLQPPDAAAGTSLPLLGWSLAGGDLRPAHFVGIHAEQVLPLAGLVLARRGTPQGRLWAWAAALAYVALFAATVGVGLVGWPA